MFAQLPKLLELVGLGYTAWFVYRYLLFKVPGKFFGVDLFVYRSRMLGYLVCSPCCKPTQLSAEVLKQCLHVWRGCALHQVLTFASKMWKIAD